VPVPDVARGTLGGSPFFEGDAFSPAKRRQLSGPGLRTFLALANLWNLDEEQRLRILGSPSRSTFYGWQKAVQERRDITLGFDTLVRISAVLGIWSALQILYGDEKRGIAWLRGPHQATVFGGKSPLELMTSGTQDALLVTRRFLDGARGGLYMRPNEIDRDFAPYRDEDIVRE
jgi:uncharacterized protein (DUF2384 family)